METKYEIAFGNIFMETFEETHLYPLIKEKLELLLRYIHDTFFIWTSSESNLLQFISKTNEMHPSIKFDVNCLNTQINFLGTKKKKKKKIAFREIFNKLYRREINWQSYLHGKLEHLENLKRSILFSQELWLKEILKKILKNNLKYLQRDWAKEYTIRMKYNNKSQTQQKLKKHKIT